MLIIDRIQVRETLILDDAAGIRTTADGYLTATPRVARTGIQIYAGAEVGRPAMDRVRVWRPEEEVFNTDAMASLAHRPITNDHPSEPVTAANWKKLAVGAVGDTVARDGEFIRVPIALMDQGVIRDVVDGKREISLGYSANLEWRKGQTPTGDHYDAVQTMIRINHLAIVDAARGGPKLSVGDSASAVGPEIINAAAQLIAKGRVDKAGVIAVGDAGTHVLYLVPTGTTPKYPFASNGKVYRRSIIAARDEAAKQGETAVADAAESLLKMIDAKKEGTRNMSTESLKVIVIDGVPAEMSDIAAAVVQRQITVLEAARDALRTKLDATEKESAKALADAAAALDVANKAGVAKDAEIAALKSAAADAAMTPAKLNQLVTDRNVVIAKAQIVLGDTAKVDVALSDDDIRKQVVLAKMGDTAKAYTADLFRVAFDTLTASIDVAKLPATPALTAADHMQRAFSTPIQSGDKRLVAQANYDKRISEDWKTPAAA